MLPADIPLRRDAESPWPTNSWSYGATIVGLGLILGLLVLQRRGGAAVAAVGGVGVRRLFGGPAERQVRVLESSRLGQQATVHVVEWQGRQWLVASSAHAITVLGDRDVQAAAAQGGA